MNEKIPSDRKIWKEEVKNFIALESMLSTAYCAFTPLKSSLLNCFCSLPPHHPRSINTAPRSHMNNLFWAACSLPRHFSLGWSICWRERLPSSFFLSFPLFSVSACSLGCKVFFNLYLSTGGFCWACMFRCSSALLHIHTPPLYSLCCPIKMAVPLLLAPCSRVPLL